MSKHNFDIKNSPGVFAGSAEEAQVVLDDFAKETLPFKGTMLIAGGFDPSAVLFKTDFPKEYFKSGQDFAWNVYSIFQPKEVHVFLLFKNLNSNEEFNFHLQLSQNRERNVAGFLQIYPTVGIIPGSDAMGGVIIGEFAKDQIAILKMACEEWDKLERKLN